MGTPTFSVPEGAVYLDVEGVPDRDFYYLVGLRCTPPPQRMKRAQDPLPKLPKHEAARRFRDLGVRADEALDPMREAGPRRFWVGGGA